MVAYVGINDGGRGWEKGTDEPEELLVLVFVWHRVARLIRPCPAACEVDRTGLRLFTVGEGGRYDTRVPYRNSIIRIPYLCWQQVLYSSIIQYLYSTSKAHGAMGIGPRDGRQSPPLHTSSSLLRYRSFIKFQNATDGTTVPYRYAIYLIPIPSHNCTLTLYYVTLP
ncbi:unnamed protein product [Tuber melanosporum]|uniref:(Perigord truffle) hypothetical protein n=1 Tax=Tuber melanosporum (strain Mel28) TaxID=656061 RepID=D5G4K8_TUBMM|nr:uncharacterized protein GSTUM_00004202001 [Tuber melanosporum]CAZ79451.1 unnamed protein product [Tuber melanosporum]